MSEWGWLQVVLFFGLLALAIKPLGSYMARVYQGERTFLDRLVRPVERLVYRLLGIRSEAEMPWGTYAVAVLAFGAVSMAALYALQRLQAWLPGNPLHLGAVHPDVAFNTAASFVTNTNWQSYSGESTMSSLVQMLGMTVQNFVSAATGMAVLAALARGLGRSASGLIGSFWVDLTRSILYILVPLSLVVALLLVSQGVVQTLAPPPTAHLTEALTVPGLGSVTTQTIPVGPVASQVAIKQLGTNGGGYYNANSAHPFENPTPLTNGIESLSLVLLAAASCFMFGRMVGDTRQGWALLAAMSVIFIVALGVAVRCELAGNPALASLHVDQRPSLLQPGGNMEGKEARLGPVASALWATATAASSNGSVNSMHDSMTAMGGLIPMVLIQLGEVIYGGVGSGLYGMLAFVIVAVFVAGLMVGRTPEYLGKKVEAYEVKMSALMILIPPLLVLLGTALAVTMASGRTAALNPGPHGFSEVLYAFSSAGNNNGSAFAGLDANRPFYNVVLGLVMLVARYWLAIPALAIAGAMAAKKQAPAGEGTLPTHTSLFVGWLVAVIVMVGGLSFLPALALGPIVEQLSR
jgi:potassium-transporting ATPase potassium-binding subunit